jgi:hypothetical protein
MRTHTLAALAGCLLLAAGMAQAAPDVAARAPDSNADAAVELSGPMKDAVALAKAAGGGVGYVGSLLAIDEAKTPVEVAIIQPVPVEKMKLGEIVMLVKDGCKAVVGCLMARRITEKRGGEVATRRYGRPGVVAGKEGVEASVVGRVAYTVDLKTGQIRDMRKDDTKPISFVEALTRESRKWHRIGDTVRRSPIKT